MPNILQHVLIGSLSNRKRKYRTEVRDMNQKALKPERCAQMRSMIKWDGVEQRKNAPFITLAKNSNLTQMTLAKDNYRLLWRDLRI
jgi:hypothetical protein